MKTLIGILTVGFVLGLGAGAFAADMGSPAKAGKDASARTVNGEVLKIDGENYVVKDAAGKEVKLHVNAQTKKEGDIKVGDKIEAQSDGSGHAVSIKAAKYAQICSVRAGMNSPCAPARPRLLSNAGATAFPAFLSTESVMDWPQISTNRCRRPPPGAGPARSHGAPLLRTA